MLVQFPNVLLHTDRSDYPEKNKTSYFSKAINAKIINNLIKLGVIFNFSLFIVDNENCATNSDFFKI